MIVIVFLIFNAAAFCFGYHRGMGFIERNYEGFKHYVDSTLDELEIQKSKQ